MNFIGIKNIAFVVSAAALLGLAGCGGGGDSGSSASAPTTPTAVTAAKSQALAKVSLQGLVFGNSSGSTSGFTTLVGGVQVSSVPQHGMSVLNLIDYAVKQVESSQGTPPSLTGMTMIPTSACKTSGTLGMVDTRTASNVRYTTSDTATLTFSQCNTSGTVLNGTIVFSNMGFSTTLNQTTGKYPLISATMTMNLTMSTPAVGSTPASTITLVNVATGFSTNATTTTDILSGTSMKVVSGTDNIEYSKFSFTLITTIATGDVNTTTNFTVGSTSIGGTITVATPSPFVTLFGAANPSSGVMEITSNLTPPDLGALRVTVSGSNVTVDFFANGFTTNNVANTATSSSTYTWSTI